MCHCMNRKAIEMMIFESSSTVEKVQGTVSVSQGLQHNLQADFLLRRLGRRQTYVSVIISNVLPCILLCTSFG